MYYCSMKKLLLLLLCVPLIFTTCKKEDDEVPSQNSLCDATFENNYLLGAGLSVQQVIDEGYIITGAAGGYHLHFELIKSNKKIDPKFLI